MSDYDGTVIHKNRDTFGELIVAESGLVRSLYFGKRSVQSSMFIDFPDDLVLYYSRAIMSALIFNRYPKRALIIGLGGGSLVKFLLRACPDCRITVVELRQKVIELAHEYFSLPENHANLQIINADGWQYIMDRRIEESSPFDLIFVDAYDDSGLATAVEGIDFMTKCKQCLSRDGVLAYNLWTGPNGNFPRCRDMLDRVFDGSVLQLVLPGKKGHALVFAFQKMAILRNLKKLRKTARQLRSDFHIDFAKFLDTIRQQNNRFFIV